MYSMYCMHTCALYIKRVISFFCLSSSPINNSPPYELSSSSSHLPSPHPYPHLIPTTLLTCFLLGNAFSSVQFRRSVMSDSLRPHEPQHARLPCPSPTPRVYPNSCPLIWWCHPTISSSVVPFSSCLQSLPASGSFPKSQLFSWGRQSIGVSASASVIPIA